MGMRRTDEIALDHLERVEAEFDRDPLHQPFQREIHLRTAKSAVEPARRLVGDDDTVAHRDMSNVVGAGQVAVHAVERRRLGRAQMGAAILHLVPVERQNPAVAATAAASVVTRLVAETERVRCSSRSSIHLTGRPATRDAAPISTI